MYYYFGNSNWYRVLMMMKTLPIKDMVITGFLCQSCILSNNSETTEVITNLKYRP